MSELLSVALVCAGTLLAQDCSRDTALDVIVAPAHSPIECLMHAQTMAAQAGLLDGCRATTHWGPETRTLEGSGDGTSPARTEIETSGIEVVATRDGLARSGDRPGSASKIWMVHQSHVDVVPI